jgi:hypothetical protein
MYYLKKENFYTQNMRYKTNTVRRIYDKQYRRKLLNINKTENKKKRKKEK